ncbi:MAG: phenylalanine--tRNA ligase subunit beta [Candidatus Competibacteraceae bacterium]
MKVSEQWLRQWVDPAITTAELASQLTLAGLEVDSIEPAVPTFSGVVVGEVIELTPHPQADRLRVARVDAGQGEPWQVVCGAPNVRVGMRAPLALLGAVLPDGTQIVAAELRGVASQGMLCSARELGLEESSEGLLELPADSSPGEDLRRLLCLDDRIIDIDLTPNRGDCLGMAGVAREVGVLNRCEVSFIAADPVAAAIDAVLPVTLSAPADCPRYVGRVIREIDPNAETPLWMQERLRRAGLRPISPLVDVTNYVMLELGQPMHAFDLHRLTGGIEVRRAQAGETLELLNGNRVDLDTETLLIADRRGPLAIAGIMGGVASAVDEQTRDVFLESAFFSPTVIAGRARRYGLSTDSSHRFERGVDPQLQIRAMERATRLLLDITGGRPGPIIEAVAPEYLPAEPAIKLRSERIRRLLGLEIDAEQVVEILTRLGMAVADEGDHWLVVPPSFRFDLTLEADLIEELGRIYGYSRLPSRTPLLRMGFHPQPETQVALSRWRETLIQRGFQEAITYSFVDPRFAQTLDPERQPLALANPISEDLAVMRTTLWAGLIKALAYNQKRQQTRIRLFEIGLNFQPQAGELVQERYIGGVVYGEALPEQWGESRRMVDFFDLKADMEALLALTGRSEAFTFVAASHPALHPGQTARIDLDGRPCGWLGALHPAVERQLELEGPVFVFELRAEAIAGARMPQFSELSKFPASRRDIAVVVDEGVAAGEVARCIQAHGGELLREVRLFDVYRGENLPAGRKSLAFGLILQDFSRNLTDQVMDETIAKIIAGLATQLGATLRV